MNSSGDVSAGGDTSNLTKIESFMGNPAYIEAIEYIANYNTRLCLERRQRLPFHDQQTGIGQKHSQLYVDRRHRMPGLRHGQVYTYPAARWRKGRRQYLYKGTTREANNVARSTLPSASVSLLQSSTLSSMDTSRNSLNTSELNLNSLFCPGYSSFCNGLRDSSFNGQLLLDDSSNSGNISGSIQDTGKMSMDSKHLQLTPQHHQSRLSKQQTKSTTPSSTSKDNLSKDWYYMNDLSMNDSDGYDEPKSSQDDDEFDYDPRYGVKKRKKRKNNSNGSNSHNNSTSHGKNNGSNKKGAGGGASGGGGGGAGGSSGANKKSTPSDGTKKRSKSGQGRGRPSNNSNTDKFNVSGSRGILQDEAPYQPAGEMLLQSSPSSSIMDSPMDDANGKKTRGASTRGRRRLKSNANNNNNNNGNGGGGGANHLMTSNQAMGLIPLPHAMHHNQQHNNNNQRHHHHHTEPPSFESMAAAVGSVNNC